MIAKVGRCDGSSVMANCHLLLSRTSYSPVSKNLDCDIHLINLRTMLKDPVRHVPAHTCVRINFLSNLCNVLFFSNFFLLFLEAKCACVLQLDS